MQIALVYPEVLDLARFKEKRKEFPPFGVMYLASMAEEAGYDVAIHAINQETKALNLSMYDVVGFSIPSSATYSIVKEVKDKSTYNEHVTMMVGGVHPNIYPKETFLDLRPDILCVGEGEYTFLELLASLPTKDFSHVQGIYYMRDGQPFFTGHRNVDQNLDWLPLPARHLLPEEAFVMNDRLSNTDVRMAHVMFSRGCPFKCTFCAVAQTKIQYRSGVHAKRELVQLIDQYAIEGFAVTDDNFIVAPKKVLDIAHQIKDLNLSWSALSRVDTVSDTLLQEIFDAGCIELKFGVESGSESILRAMQKNTTRRQIIHTVKQARKIGIKVKTFVIHGYPGETMDTTNETLSLLVELKPYVERVSLFRFVPLPGTYVFEHPDEFALRNTNSDPNWDGDWSRYHIHHNNYHWWGTDDDFAEVEYSYQQLRSFIEAEWPTTFHR